MINWEELKDSVRNADIIAKPKEKKETVADVLISPYAVPCTKEPFEGNVIELSGDEFNLYFQSYGIDYPDEFSFRDKLENIDDWLFDKPHKVQRKWPEYLTKWLDKR